MGLPPSPPFKREVVKPPRKIFLPSAGRFGSLLTPPERFSVEAMRLTVLGSGTAVPHARRSSSAHWLEATGGTLMLDISATAVHRAAQEGFDWAGLDAVW